MATIKDVARQAEVSVTTVSHVVNGTRFVSDEARQRVQQAIDALRYVPSALARSLKNNRTHTIGTMIPNCSNPYFAEIVRGIEDACFAAGFTVVLCNSDDDPRKQGQYLRVLTEKQVDGLIVVSSGGDSELGEALREAEMALVLVDREVENVNADLVEVNHERGGWLAVRHLIELGHRRIACISGPLALSPSAQRVQGCRRALAEAGLGAIDAMLREADFTSAGGHAAMRDLLAGSAPRPTAVFACNDLSAIGAMAAAAQAGLSVPKDLSVVGFDDIALAAYASPPLTTVAQPKHRLGTLAATLLLERIAQRDLASRRRILQPALRLRQSTAAAPTARRGKGAAA
jgi:LacI family transcriptional regulator